MNSEKLKGLVFCVTGTLSHYTRKEIHDVIESLGGITQGNVNLKTNYLLVGTDTVSPIKVATAKGFGIKILNEHEFHEFLID